MTDSRLHTTLSGIAIALGVIGAAFVLGMALKDMKMSERSVTVRGLAEREVRADLAVWTLKFKSSGSDLLATQNAMEMQRKNLVAFLTAQAFNPQEMQVTGVRVFDRQAQEYGSNNAGLERYVLESGLQLRTHDIDKVEATSQKTSELILQGVTLSGEHNCANIPNYMFTKLNDIKPQMMAEATKNAREAAQQFATDAQAEVGTIRSATQGYFSIAARDSVEGQGGGYDCGDSTSPNKRVRVVTTIDYYLQ